MTEAQKTYPERAWISAEDSFARQPEALAGMIPALTAQLAEAPPRPERLTLVGIGASHAAAASPLLAMRRDGIDAARMLPSELAGQLPSGLTGFLSQSGRSAEVIEAARMALPGQGVSVTNYDPSPLSEIVPAGLRLGNHSDSSVSFLTFTGTILALGLLADRWAGRDEAGRWQDAIAEGCAAVEVLGDRLTGIAGMLTGAAGTDFVAPAPLLSAAEEAALMFREGPRLLATAMETRQYLHGPMDAAGPGAHVVLGAGREALLIDQLAERSEALVFVTGPNGGTAVSRAPKAEVIELPVGPDDPLRFAIVASILMQKLTLETSARRGIDINEKVFTRLDTKTDRAA